MKALREFQEGAKLGHQKSREIEERESKKSLRKGGSGGIQKENPNQVTPAAGSENAHDRLVGDDASTPKREPQNDSESEHGGEELTEDEEIQLQEAFQYLDELRHEGKLTAKQVDDLIEWAEDEIDNGETVDDVVNILKRAKKRVQIYSLPRFVGSKRVPQITLSYPRKSRRENTPEVPLDSLVEDDDFKAATPMLSEARSSSESVPSEEQWAYFRDEYAVDMKLDEVSVKVWNAEMDVKIKKAENVIKEITAQAVSKKEKFSKFKVGDVFEKYARDLKAEILNVPFC